MVPRGRRHVGPRAAGSEGEAVGVDQGHVAGERAGASLTGGSVEMLVVADAVGRRQAYREQHPAPVGVQVHDLSGQALGLVGGLGAEQHAPGRVQRRFHRAVVHERPALAG